MLLEAKDISINFGQKQVLDQVNLKITPQSRIGLVGVNGAGKSTLMKCLMDEIEPQAGSIQKGSNIQVQYLSQNPSITAGNTLKEELYSVFEDIFIAKKEEAELLTKLEELSGDEFDEAIVRIGELQEIQERLDVSKLDEKIGRMITGLGFSLEELNRDVAQFSGGWQMRINLAKVLLQEADVILMDEPTNHLDMEACSWLEEFLRNYPHGIVLVSHDRRFLNEVVTEIAELERGQLKLYSGNYTQYLKLRQEERLRLSAAAERQAKEIEKQKVFIDRFRASARKSTQAKSRERQLAKVEIIEAPHTELKKLKFEFPDPKPSGTEILKIDNLAKSFKQEGTEQDLDLFKSVNLELLWEKDEPQRVFILGPNGCGKTTFFKILMGLEKPNSGSVNFDPRVMLGYYAQHQLQILDPEKTVLETLEEAIPKELEEKMTHTEVRKLLARFLFTNDEVFKKVSGTSGGEKARLALAKLMITGPNVLLLDEPTNHLDTSAQEAVEEALAAYKGTVICISHDRYFIDNHATQIWEFIDGHLIVYKGRYEHYLEKRDSLIAEMRNKEGLNDSSADANATEELTHHEKHLMKKEREKTLKKLEKQLEQLATRKKELEAKIADPEISADYKELEKHTAKLLKLETELSEIESEWLELTS